MFKLTIETPDVDLVSLLLTLNVFDMLLYCIYFLLTLKMEMVDGIRYWLNLNLFMHFIVGSRIPVMFQTKLYVTAIYLPAITYFLSETAPS